MYSGTYTALVTPFKDDRIDAESFRNLIEYQVKGGVSGLVPVGTTGESPTLDHEEHARVVEMAVEFAAGRCRIVAGTGSNSTREAISLTKDAEKAGVDAALLVSPYYNKPTQEGLFQHFKAIAESTSLDLILYSIPGRCVVEIGVDTVARLAEACPNIVGIKEAGGTVERVSRLKDVLPGSFVILSGDDSMTLPFLSVGAVGVISVASNLIPGEIVRMIQAWENERAGVAREIHAKYYRLFKALFIETSPVPIKTALSYVGLTPAECRLPLCEISEANAAVLRETMIGLGLIDS